MQEAEACAALCGEARGTKPAVSQDKKAQRPAQGLVRSKAGSVRASQGKAAGFTSSIAVQVHDPAEDDADEGAAVAASTTAPKPVQVLSDGTNGACRPDSCQTPVPINAADGHAGSSHGPCRPSSCQAPVPINAPDGHGGGGSDSKSSRPPAAAAAEGKPAETTSGKGKGNSAAEQLQDEPDSEEGSDSDEAARQVPTPRHYQAKSCRRSCDQQSWAITDEEPTEYLDYFSHLMDKGDETQQAAEELLAQDLSVDDKDELENCCDALQAVFDSKGMQAWAQIRGVAEGGHHPTEEQWQPIKQMLEATETAVAELIEVVKKVRASKRARLRHKLRSSGRGQHARRA